MTCFKLYAPLPILHPLSLLLIISGDMVPASFLFPKCFLCHIGTRPEEAIEMAKNIIVSRCKCSILLSVFNNSNILLSSPYLLTCHALLLFSVIWIPRMWVESLRQVGICICRKKYAQDRAIHVLLKSSFLRSSVSVKQWGRCHPTCTERESALWILKGKVVYLDSVYNRII